MHPRNGEEITVLKSHGPDALWVEMADGMRRIVPVGWTDWRPQPAALQLGGDPVRLAPEAMKALSAWVAGRRAEADGKKVGPPPDPVAEVRADGTANDDDIHGGAACVPAGARARHSRRRSAAAVVEQVGAPDAHRRGDSRTRKRGAR